MVVRRRIVAPPGVIAHLLPRDATYMTLFARKQLILFTYREFLDRNPEFTAQQWLIVKIFPFPSPCTPLNRNAERRIEKAINQSGAITFREELADSRRGRRCRVAEPATQLV
jgi:hypothetical protein